MQYKQDVFLVENLRLLMNLFLLNFPRIQDSFDLDHSFSRA